MGTTTTGEQRGGIGECAPQENVAGADRGPEEWIKTLLPLDEPPLGDEARIDIGELRLVLMALWLLANPAIRLCLPELFLLRTLSLQKKNKSFKSSKKNFISIFLDSMDKRIVTFYFTIQ